MEDSNRYGPEVIDKPNCAVCFHDSEESIVIVCDHCLIWFHLECVELKAIPKISIGSIENAIKT